MGTLRRKRGEGSVWEQTRADGTNYWRGSVPLLDGSKKYFTAETKEAAEAVRAILLGQARSGHLMRSTPVGKVRDEVSSWIIGRTAGGSSSKGSARKALDPATAQGYKRSLEQLICRPKSGGMRFCLGDMPADAVSRLHVQHWVDDLMDASAKDKLRNVDEGKLRYTERKLSASYIRQAYSVLSQTYDSLVYSGVVSENPVKQVRRPSQEPVKSFPLLPDDLAQVMAAAKNERLYARWLVALSLGLRPGEALGLRWGLDVDMDSRVIIVQGQMAEGGGVHYKPKTKTQNVRVLPMDDNLFEAFKVHKEQQAAEKAAVGESWKEFEQNGIVYDLVFRHEDGRRIAPREDYDMWNELIDHTDINKKTTRYITRHTAASYMLAGGTDAVTTASILGHASPATTLNVYAHALPGHRQEAVNAMGSTLQAALEKGQDAILANPDISLEDINAERTALGLEPWDDPSAKDVEDEPRDRSRKPRRR